MSVRGGGGGGRYVHQGDDPFGNTSPVGFLLLRYSVLFTLCFISFLCLDLYVLGDVALVS